MNKNLKDGHLACKFCGRGVAPRNQKETFTIKSYGVMTGNLPRMSQHDREFETVMTRCRDCQGRRERAEELLEEFPDGRYVFMSDSMALEAIEATLDICAYIGQVPTIRRAKDLRLLLEELVGLAKVNAYFALYVPLAEPQARPGKCNSKPWGHIGKEEGAVIREAYVSWLRRRSEVATDIEHPTGGGCYVCGVGSVFALPSNKEYCWREKDIAPVSMGGKGYDRKTVTLCGPCFVKGEEIGAYGWTLLYKGIFKAAGLEHRYRPELHIPKAVAWGELGLSTPNKEPFDHYV